MGFDGGGDLGGGEAGAALEVGGVVAVDELFGEAEVDDLDRCLAEI